MANGKRQRPTANGQQAADSRQMAAGKWQMAKGSVGKNTFWPGHAPWATASSGVPAGAQHKLSLARDLPASLRRRQKKKKKRNRFPNSITNTFPPCFLPVLCFTLGFCFFFVLSALKCSVIFCQNVSLYQCEVLKKNGSDKRIEMMHRGIFDMFGIY